MKVFVETKKILCLFALVFVQVSLFAAQGILWGKKDIRVAKTQFFDIIYTAECEESAKILYGGADEIYKEIAALYGIDQDLRMPVVLTPAVENFNAYWTSYPYNHIVIYDTYPVGDLEVFSETLLSTFRHELTHAYTYNLKSPLWQKIGKIFGDAVNPASFYITLGWAEGATLTSESAGGEGRLNNPYSNFMVRQAKLEGKFSSYSDMQGAGDQYPAGAFYYFNGAFSEYLQKTYGMQKYAEFWYNCVNAKNYTSRGAFKKVYGLKVDEAWKNFYSSIKNPEIPSNPETAGIVRDFFNSSDFSYSAKNSSYSLYSNLVSSKKGIYFLNKKNASVYFLDFNDFSFSKNSPKKLFSLSGIQSFSVSQSGNFLALSVIQEKGASQKSLIKIYDCKKKKFFTLKQTSVYSPAIVESDDGIFLVNSGFKNARSALHISKIDFGKNGNIKKICKVKTYELLPNQNCSSFADLGNSSFAFIFRDKLNFSIAAMDLNGNFLFKKELPQKMVAKYLNFSQGKIYFSYAQEDSFPRAAFYDLEKNSFVFSKKDISGGVFYCTELPFEADEGNLVYTANFFRNSKIFIAKKENLFEKENSLLISDLISQGDSQILNEENEGEGDEGEEFSEDGEVSKVSGEKTDFELPYKKYNPLWYYRRGIFLPTSMVQSQTYIPSQTNAYYLPYGVSYLTSNPWDSNTLFLSAGYGIETNSAAFLAQFSSGTSSSLFNYAAKIQSEFCEEGWRTSDAALEVSSAVPLLLHSASGLSFSSTFHIGKANKTLSYDATYDATENYSLGSVRDENTNLHLYSLSSLSLYFSTVSRRGTSTLEKGGFSIIPAVSYCFNENLTSALVYKNFLNLGLSAKVYIPRLLPLENRAGFVYNLPSKIKFSLFPADISSLCDDTLSLSFETAYSSSSIYSSLSGKNVIAALRSETVLFSVDIQKAVEILPLLYVNEARFSLAFTGAMYKNEDVYSSWRFLNCDDYFWEMTNGQLNFMGDLTLRTVLAASPNFGSLARSSARQNFYFEAGISLGEDFYKTVFSLGLESAF